VSRGHRPKASLGQNFLVDANLQRKVVEAVGAGPDDAVLEVGPGREALTRHLQGRVGRLILVELDDELAGRLEVRYGDRQDVELVHADILETRVAELVTHPERLLVVGNIPYNITTPILFHLLARPRPRALVLMVQDEVAERIVAEAGSSAYGALTVGVQSVARARKLFRVGRKAFRPVPGVDSAVIRVEPIRPEPLDADEERALRRLVRACFQWRRKQLRKILRDHPDLSVPREEIQALAQQAGFRPTDRPETLSPEGFVRLARALPSEGREG